MEYVKRIWVGAKVEKRYLENHRVNRKRPLIHLRDGVDH